MTLGLCCALATPVVADAQVDQIKALEQRLEGSVVLIEKLSARIAELERKALGAAVAAPVAVLPQPTQAASTAAITELQDSVARLTEGMNRRSTDSGLALHGFADVGAAWSSRGDPNKLRGFNAGTLDLYLTPQFGDRVKGLVEIAIEYGKDGGVAIDLERLQLGYTVNDSVTVWLGRFHTPFGSWNTAFHHGANLQTSISRPRFIEFEDKGGILPVHSVGVWASGRHALGSGRVTYDAYVNNGPRIADRTLDFNAFTDSNANKMLGINLGYQAGGALSGLTVGVHGFGASARVHELNGAVISDTKLRMAGGYLAYDEHDWEVMAETYRFANVDLGSRARRASQMGFLQVGKTIGAWTPFVRLERVALDPADNYFRSQESGRSYRRSAFGLRYAIDPRSSFKFEFSDSHESAAELIDETGAVLPIGARSYRRAAFQYSVAF